MRLDHPKQQWYKADIIYNTPDGKVFDIALLKLPKIARSDQNQVLDSLDDQAMAAQQGKQTLFKFRYLELSHYICLATIPQQSLNVSWFSLLSYVLSHYIHPVSFFCIRTMCSTHLVGPTKSYDRRETYTVWKKVKMDKKWIVPENVVTGIEFVWYTHDIECFCYFLMRTKKMIAYLQRFQLYSTWSSHSCMNWRNQFLLKFWHNHYEHSTLTYFPIVGSPAYVIGHGLLGEPASMPPYITAGVISKVVKYRGQQVMVQVHELW